MIVEVKVPSPGESVTEVEIGSWLVEDGALVHKDQEIAEVESDKATLTIVAGESGKLSIKTGEGETVEVGAVVCTIDTSMKPEEKPEEKDSKEKGTSPEAENQKTHEQKDTEAKDGEVPGKKPTNDEQASHEYDQVKITPVAKAFMKEEGISIDDVIKGLKRIGKKEVEAAMGVAGDSAEGEWRSPKEASREVDRNRMTPLRRKLAERLVAVKNETAMLTTFNEIDMGSVMELRKKYQQQFVEMQGFKLGFMSFFTKAVALAMNSHPMVNAQLDGDEIVSPQFVDVGIAVSTPKGLMVPIVRNAESKTIPQIELEIKELAEKARNKKISVDELTGGTFTITNGGVFGSLLSTPVINPPQSAILGMHNIVDRPVAINGQVVIRPMMYVALSYDHRIIDGKDSVGFLVRVKEFIEHPERMFTGGKEPEKLLLGI
jgi:2-oxoglutarate dehydrogenase E2 component (dihydrolipoamide succinyltransferase)